MTHRAFKHHARAFVALVVAAIAALTLAACGGSDDDGGGSSGGGKAADARTVLRETFTNVNDVDSGRMRVALEMRERGGQSVKLGVDGAFVNKGEDYPEFDVDVDVNIAGQGSFAAGLVSTSDRLFVSFQGQSYEVPAELLDSAKEQADEGAEPRIDRSLIPDLRVDEWGIDPELVGQEDVGGVRTDHVRATVDVRAFLDALDGVLGEIARAGLGGPAGDQMPSELPDDARAEVEQAVRAASVDIWTGADDRILRRLRVDLEIEPRGERGGTASLLVELTELDEPQRIVAPKDVRPFEELMGGLAPLLGLGASLGDEPSVPSSDRLDAYSRCLADAGGDVGAAQRCAALLEG